MNLRHVHASGRFTASNKYLTAALDFYAYDTEADLITVTEMSPNKYNASLQRWALRNKFELYHPLSAGRDECAILSRRRLVNRRTWRLSDLTLRSGRTAPIYLVAAEIKSGPSVGVWHSPAHNEGLKPGLWPTRVYRDSMAGLHVARMQMHGHGLLLPADYNLDLRRPEVRDELTKHFPHLHFGIEGHQANTEGGRVIDGVLTNLPIIAPSRTLPAQPGFDHNAVLTVLGKK